MSPLALNVLLVEDNPGDARLVREHLADVKGTGFKLEVVGTLAAALGRLSKPGIAVVLLDLGLPDSAGLETLNVVQSSTPDLPAVVVITGLSDEDIAVKAVQAGAQDYLVKGTIDGVLLARALRYAVERKRADEAWRASEIRYRRLFESAKDGILILDAETGMVVDANPFLTRLLGLSHEQLLGKQLWELGFFRDVVASRANFVELQQKEYVRYEDLPLETADGRRIEVEFVSNVYLANDRKVIQCNIRDNTEHKRTENALRASEQRLRRFYESGMIGVIYWNMDGRLMDANDKFLEMVGYTRDELARGQLDWLQMTPPEHRHLDVESVAELKATGVNKKPFEKEYIRKDGTRVPILLAGAMLDEARFNGVAFVLDTTELMKAKKELANKTEQFLQSQKLEAIGQLAGGVAHDMNNALSAILGYCELILPGLAQGDPLAMDIGEIAKAADRAAGLTRQLLAFSRKQVLQPRTLELNSVVAGMEGMLRRLIGEDVELQSVLSPNLGKVRADPGQIEQVIMNLAVNARDAMPDGGRLTMETRNVDLDEEYARQHTSVVPGPHVLLAVSDTGCGMDAQTQARIFEPFFTTKERGKGTGLGLSTVYGIVKQSGGNIWVYSEPGQGSTFKIYLPRAESAVEPAVEPAPGQGLAAGRGSETVLLVEDEEVLRKLVARFLALQGYRVLEAPGGGEALLTSERHDGPIHLLLTDVIMPRMSGRELADRLTAQRPEMRVLYMSGYTDNAIVHHGVLDAGMHFVEKPFTTAGLARKLHEVLDAPRPSP